MDSNHRWPKSLPPLTLQQQEINDDFVKYWHEVLPRRFGFVDRFNHLYPVKHAPLSFLNTLEVGAGLGEHLQYEKLSSAQLSNYVAVDIRQNMIDELRKRYPQVVGIVADCQERLPYVTDHFDRVLAIHVLEHLPNLPAAVKELHRVCHKDHGILSIVIPCEGSLAYLLARRISAQRIFEKRYKQSYRWFIEREHLSRPFEIFEELAPYFEMDSSSYFPLPVKAAFCNLCIGATLRPRVL